jgi:uncharacterized protein (TIGR02246 family)
MPRHAPPPAAVATLGDSPDEVEAQFYEALQRADIERLMAVWADDDDIVCVHPGGGSFIGPAAIRASFEGVFGNGGGIPVVPEQVHRLQHLGSAVHHLVERISVTAQQGTQTAWVVATNVYAKTVHGWRLLAHHASPGTPHERPAPAGDAPTTLH